MTDLPQIIAFASPRTGVLASSFGPVIAILFFLIFWAIRAISSVAAQEQKRKRENLRQSGQFAPLGAPPDSPIPRPIKRFEFPTRIGQPGSPPPPPAAHVYRPPPLPPQLQSRPPSARPQLRPPPPPPPRTAPKRRPFQKPTHRPLFQQPAPRQPTAAPSRPVAPPPELVAAPLPSDRASKSDAPAPTAHAISSPRPSVGASAINRWMRPRTLQSQFILTEIFQPPLAMRDQQY